MLNITIKYSQTERGLVFNSRLWILLSLLVSHPSRHYFSYFSCLLCICMYVWLNKWHNWHMLGCGSAGKFYFLSFCHYLWISWHRGFDVFSMATTKFTGPMKPWSNFCMLFCLTCQFFYNCGRSFAGNNCLRRPIDDFFFLW